MLQPPESSFTIPSIHDDTPLDCRLYHPSRPNKASANEWSTHQTLGAILAHPYAPLGGCYDDPVVQIAAAELLRCGFIVGTFNFRGAGSSKGRTSWTSKPELEDYISFVGFLVHYLDNLKPLHIEKHVGHLRPASANSLSIVQSNGSKMILILGGYSYGSLVTKNLPNINIILSHFVDLAEGIAEAEIRLRALRLSTWRNTETHGPQRGRELAAQVSMGATHSITVGGDESQQGARQASKEPRLSIDVVRRSMDRSRMKLGLVKHSFEEEPTSSSVDTKLTVMEMPKPQVHYLLISPLLPPISLFATMFSKPQLLQRSYPFPRATGTKGNEASSSAELLLNHPTLAIYGDKDFFTSYKKLQHWAEDLARRPGSRFRYLEVTGAGHFWHEEGVEVQLRKIVRGWGMDISNGLGDTF